ncbi:MAG: hypothetical protein J6S67_05820 [Methanobrevibacter sp.]|nr:hypothetical protein [Methanobrevibacter sp.]
MINILGIDYKLKENCKVEEYPQLEESEAFSDFSSKEIIISEYDRNENSIKDLDYHIRKVKRHEIIHTFLFESGLDCNTDWATNEEMVDWFAIQYPKIKKIFEKLNIEE